MMWPVVDFQTESVEDELVILAPAPVPRSPTTPIPGAKADDKPVTNPYNLDNYLLSSSEGFSPFEQNLGEAPFHDLHGEDIWPALAYVEDGGIHPGKV